MSADRKQTHQNDAERLPFLLEIGSEEIPARFIPAAMKDLERLFRAELKQAHLAAAGIRVVATPRRMALLVEALAVRQPDRDLEIKGPPVSVAFDEGGQPTPAGLGFARKVGLELAECGKGKDKRGEFLLARITESGVSAAEVLGEIIPRVVLGVPYRKVMRWGDGEMEYPRPLQWFVSLLGEDVVPARVGEFEAGRVSRGHRTLAKDAAVEITSAASYLPELKAAGVMADQEERRRVITAGFDAALKEYDTRSRLVADEELLTEIVFLCEHPTPFLGAYSEEYAELPAAVVTTALKAHQRYFSVGSKDRDDLLPRFAAVRDGGAEHLPNVIAGNERVLHARLADAYFYWNFDQKKSPDERTAMLETVTWLEGFGSVLAKTRRLAELAAWLWGHGLGEGDEVPADLTRAAAISKSDLVSEMIKDGKEFTKLEGFIGARYAALAGESPAVCAAIEGHYLPRSSAGKLPADRYSAVLSVADRLDNIAGCWLAGFVPTGAKDPYALRRHVLAMLRILLDLEARLDLEQALGVALAGMTAYCPPADRQRAALEIGEFIKTRMGGYFGDTLAADPEVVRAVLPVRWADPVDTLAWIRALGGYREQADFQLLATGFKRCRNILKGDVLPMSDLGACLERWEAGGQGGAGEDFSLLPEAAEQDLLSRVVSVVAGLRAAEKSQDYASIFAILSGLGPAIDSYFAEVRVNAEDEALRALRHAFVREVHGLFARYADFSEVAPTDG